jgi:leucyl/phenylalanyl-tRNA--protein transferase
MHGRYYGDKQETPGDEGWEVGVLHSSGEAGELTWRTLRSEGGTWITQAMQEAYIALHDLGCAHSVEVWQEE